MSEPKPMKLGIIGGILAIAGGIGLGHWLTSGTIPMTMKAIEDAPTSSGVGALMGLLAYGAAPQLPGLWDTIKQYIPFINEVKALFPQALIDAVLAGIKSGHVDTKAIMALFKGVNVEALIKLITSIATTFGKAVVTSTDPPSTPVATLYTTGEGGVAKEVDTVIIHI